MVLPAAVATGPASTDIAETWLEGYARVHSRPAGAVTEAENDRLRATVPPGLLVADERPRLETCADAGAQRQRMPQAIAHEKTRVLIPGCEIIHDKSA
jgi:hypothetical protein